MVLGDAAGAWYETTGSEAALKNERWRGALLSISLAPNLPNRIVCDAPIPVGVGGFTIREFGLLSATGILMAIGMHQVIELPAPGDPTTLDIVIRGLLDVVNAAAVNMVVDPYIVTATRSYVDDALSAHNRLATEEVVGHIQLPTAAESIAGLLNSKAVHPAGLAAAVSNAISALSAQTADAMEALAALQAAIAANPDLVTAFTALLADHNVSPTAHMDIRASLIGRYFYAQL